MKLCLEVIHFEEMYPGTTKCTLTLLWNKVTHTEFYSFHCTLACENYTYTTQLFSAIDYLIILLTKIRLLKFINWQGFCMVFSINLPKLCATLADCRLADLQTCRLQTCRLADQPMDFFLHRQTMWHRITRLRPGSNENVSNATTKNCSIFCNAS